MKNLIDDTWRLSWYADRKLSICEGCRCLVDFEYPRGSGARFRCDAEASLQRWSSEEYEQRPVHVNCSHRGLYESIVILEKL